MLSDIARMFIHIIYREETLRVGERDSGGNHIKKASTGTLNTFSDDCHAVFGVSKS
jgi:hypothetical protein